MVWGTNFCLEGFRNFGVWYVGLWICGARVSALGFALLGFGDQGSRTPKLQD